MDSAWEEHAQPNLEGLSMFWIRRSSRRCEKLPMNDQEGRAIRRALTAFGRLFVFAD